MARKSRMFMCFICGAVFHLEIDPQDYYRWSELGEYAQDAFPYLSADERELVITHTCGDCFNAMFSEEY